MTWGGERGALVNLKEFEIVQGAAITDTIFNPLDIIKVCISPPRPF